jgi:hypothetical protein
MNGYIIVWCGHEGLERIVGLFTETEAVERMTRFRKAEFKTTHYVAPPEDDKYDEDHPHFKLRQQWTVEDGFEDQLDRRVTRLERSITRDDFPNMSEEEFKHQVHLRSYEFRFKQLVDRFCVQKIDATGAGCACTKLGVPAGEYVLY